MSETFFFYLKIVNKLSVNSYVDKKESLKKCNIYFILLQERK